MFVSVSLSRFLGKTLASLFTFQARVESTGRRRKWITDFLMGLMINFFLAHLTTNFGPYEFTQLPLTEIKPPFRRYFVHLIVTTVQLRRENLFDYRRICIDPHQSPRLLLQILPATRIRLRRWIQLHLLATISASLLLFLSSVLTANQT